MTSPGKDKSGNNKVKSEEKKAGSEIDQMIEATVDNLTTQRRKVGYRGTKAEIAKALAGSSANHEDIEKAAKGEMIFVRNLELTKNKKANAFIQFQDLKSENPKIAINFVDSKLRIGSRIGKHKLTEEEHDKLATGKTINVPMQKNLNVFVKLNPVDQSITVKSEKELGVPHIIRGHELTKKEKEAWVNKEKLPPMMLKGKKGHFIAEIQPTADGKGFTISNLSKEVKTAEAEKMLAEYKKTTKTTEKTTRTPAPKEIYSKIEKHIRDRDFNALNEISKKRQLDKKEINEIIKKTELTAEQATAVQTITKTESKEVVNDKKVDPMKEEIVDKTISKQTSQQRKGDTGIKM